MQASGSSIEPFGCSWGALCLVGYCDLMGKQGRRAIAGNATPGRAQGGGIPAVCLPRVGPPVREAANETGLQRKGNRP